MIIFAIPHPITKVLINDSTGPIIPMSHTTGQDDFVIRKTKVPTKTRARGQLKVINTLSHFGSPTLSILFSNKSVNNLAH